MIRTEDLACLPTNDLLVSNPADSDIYIKLSENKFVLLVKEGATPDPKKIKSYQEKFVQNLWIDRKKISYLLDQQLVVAQNASRSKKLTSEQKARFFYQTANTAFAILRYNGFSNSTFQQVSTLSRCFYDFALGQSGILSFIVALNESADWIARHSVCSSLMATFIGLELATHTPDSLYELTTGSLLCDIGLTRLPVEILNKPFGDMTPDEWSAFKRHPQEGYDMAQNTEGVTENMLTMILQHHERSDGSGYPLSTEQAYIHPMARIAATATEISDLICLSPSRPRVLPLTIAINAYVQKLDKQIDPKLKKALIKGLAKI